MARTTTRRKHARAARATASRTTDQQALPARRGARRGVVGRAVGLCPGGAGRHRGDAGAERRGQCRHADGYLARRGPVALVRGGASAGWRLIERREFIATTVGASATLAGLS